MDTYIEVGNDTSTFKETTSQPVRLDFMETTRKEIDTHEDDKHWTLVRRREQKWNNTIM